MRIGVAKPDYRVIGGFERVVRRVVAELRARGHEVEPLTVDMRALPRRVAGVDVDRDTWERAPELFAHLAGVEAFRALDTRGLDLVLSTQPPSYAARHERHVSLFYHHLRIFYDLSDAYLAAGHGDPPVHRAAVAAMHEVDGRLLAAVGRFLVPSQEVAGRLARFQGIVDRCDPFLAPPPAPGEASTAVPAGHVLCVSRHEFPKRTELFVAAMKLLPDTAGMAVGAGGRLAWVRRLDHRLTADPSLATRLAAEETWLCPGQGATDPGDAPGSNVAFRGFVDDGELAAAYAGAACVVAPALAEDYGLTALEAMTHGRAVVVCRDGGGLTELVRDGETGLVAEPTAAGLAAAIGRLVADPALARRLGQAGRDEAARFGWDRAMDQLLASLERVA
jgi:glycosyltransferase involved in cell wall biosynthesis